MVATDFGLKPTTSQFIYPDDGHHIFAWLIEAPGPHYLCVRKGLGHTFRWSQSANEGIRFGRHDDADLVLKALRDLNPELFAFERELRRAKPVEHGWFISAAEVAPESEREE